MDEYSVNMKHHPKQNILFITSDQQHWNTIGAFNPNLKTPNLDRLTREGMRFQRAYCPNPTCTPTRASLITGQYPSQHGAWSLGTQLMPDRPVIGDLLQEAGYRTELIGKGHFSQWRSHPGYRSLEDGSFREDPAFMADFDETTYGFELHESSHRGHIGKEAEWGYGAWVEAQLGQAWRDFSAKGKAVPYVWPFEEKYHLNAFISDRTQRLLERHHEREEPFYLWASFNDPHPPYTTPEPWASLYDPATVPLPDWPSPEEHTKNPPHFQKTQEQAPDFSGYQETPAFNHGMHRHIRWRDREDLAQKVAIYYSMISSMDHYIGRILEKLDALGLTENTLVIFTSDHGHFFGQHGLDAKGPFHYEDMVRVPFIVRQPGRIPAGVETDALISLVDVAPTMLSWLGLPVPHAMSGLDFSPVFEGTLPARRSHVVVENHHQPTAIHLKTYINARYKLTVYLNQDYGELFDLQADPGEVNNRWNDPEAAELKNELIRQLLFAEMAKEVLPMPRIDTA